MRTLSLIAAFVALVFVAHAEAAPATQPTVEVAALQVNRALSPQLSRIAQGIPRRQYYSAPDKGGVDVTLVVTVPGRQIIPTRDESLQIQTFIDDKYNDLGRSRRDQGYSSPLPLVTEDGASKMFTINSERGPAADASRMFLRGSVTLRCASDAKTSERKPLRLRVGNTVDAGPVPLRVRSISRSGTGNLSVTLEGNRTLEQIKSVRLYGTDGKEIRPGMESASYARAPVSSVSIIVPDNLEEVSVEVTYIERIELVTVPFELLIDIGAIKVGQPTTRPAPTLELGGGRTSVQPVNRTAQPADPRAPWPPPPLQETVVFPTTRPEIAWPAPPAIPQNWKAEPGTGATRSTTPPVFVAKAVSLTVNQTPEAKLVAPWAGRTDFHFRQNGGTIVRVLLSLEDRILLSVDPNRVHVERFADDTGRDLSPALHRAMQAYAPSIGGMRAFMPSADGKSVMVNVHLEDAPTPGATRVFLKGAIGARVTRKFAVAEQKDFPLLPDTVLKAGPIEMKVNSIYLVSPNISTPEAGPSGDLRDRRIAVQFRTNVSPELIRRIQFVDPDGQEVISFLSPPGPFPEEAREYAIVCNLVRDVRRATVRITYCEDVENLNVPFEILTGVGL